MDSLDLEVRLEPLAGERLPRVAQLTQRTNQSNFTTIRLAEAEIQTLCGRKADECLTVEASDRFGDYGLVGVLIFAQRGDALAIDTMLLKPPCAGTRRGAQDARAPGSGGGPPGAGGGGGGAGGDAQESTVRAVPA